MHSILYRTRNDAYLKQVSIDTVLAISYASEYLSEYLSEKPSLLSYRFLAPSDTAHRRLVTKHVI